VRQTHDVRQHSLWCISLQTSNQRTLQPNPAITKSSHQRKACMPILYVQTEFRDFCLHTRTVSAFTAWPLSSELALHAFIHCPEAIAMNSVILHAQTHIYNQFKQFSLPVFRTHQRSRQTTTESSEYEMKQIIQCCFGPHTVSLRLITCVLCCRSSSSMM